MKTLISVSAITLLFILFSGCKKEEVPIVTTTAINNITGTTAISGGIVTDEGTSTVIERGVCWSTNTKPGVADKKTSDGAGVGSFTSNLTGLDGATTYYIRAYATSSAGTGYGMVMSFTTLGQTPASNNSAASDITTTSAILNGSVNPNYLSTDVTFEYGETTSYGNSVTASQSPATGNVLISLSANIDNLTPGTVYHFRVKSVNSLGTTYSDDLTFTTLGQVPAVSTFDATGLSTTSSTLNGNINANYLSSVVSFEYGTTTDYGSAVAATQSPVEGNTDTPVSATISGLTVATVYHYRIKAQNMLGIVYGDDKTFTTLGQIPTATTQQATNINETSAKLNATVNPQYLSTVVTFEYGSTTDYGSTVTATQSPVTGSTDVNVSANITGLVLGTEYHFRVKVENQLGTVNGNDMTFTTTDLLSDYDGNIYTIITIGTQVWMAENLKTTHFNDGTAIPFINDAPTWAGLSGPGYCSYNYNSSNTAVYGLLYNWFTVNNGNLCPAGWHVPDGVEWQTLADYLGGATIAGGKLKEAGFSHWASPNTGADNSSGFTALGGSFVDYKGVFGVLGYDGYWWSTDEVSATLAAAKKLYYNAGNIALTGSNTKINGFSVRCIKTN